MSYFQQYSPGSFRVLPPVIKNLLIINVLFFLATLSLGGAYNIDLTELFGMHYFGSEKFRIWQVVTYMFMHGSFWHLFFNMFALWMFGYLLEDIWGAKRFLIYYFITGIGAIMIQMGVNFWQLFNIETAFAAFSNNPTPEAFQSLINTYFPVYSSQASQVSANWSLSLDSAFYAEEASQYIKTLIKFKMDIPTIGASGAVFGILLAFGMLFPNMLIYIYMLFPVKAKWFVIFYGAIELYSGFSNNPNDNVAHFAHLGGMFFGFFLIKYWNKKNYT